MKKSIITIVLLLMAVTVSAQQKIDAAKIAQITFNGDDVTIVYNDGTTSQTFDMEEVTLDFTVLTSISERLQLTREKGLEGKQVYDLKGRRLGKSAAALRKGIYVIDGRKVIVK